MILRPRYNHQEEPEDNVEGLTLEQIGHVYVSSYINEQLRLVLL
jgi:hypothetical protein